MPAQTLRDFAGTANLPQGVADPAVMREDGVLEVLAGHTTLNELSRTVA